MTEARKPQGRKRPGKNTFTTKSGSTIKLNRSIGERLKARRDARAQRRAAYLSTLPKNRFKRILFRLKPRELIRYWFSRDGAIMALKLMGVGIVVMFVLVVGVFAYFRKDLPNIKDISGTMGGSINYYDRTGQVLLFQDYDSVKRIAVPGDAISDNLRKATIAIEDKDFYEHGAFDVRGIMRAGFNDVFNREGGLQGGSTISQQLVKLNQKWTDDRTITRKVKELILAVELEREYSKDDILTGYLNVAPYGPIENGAQVAAQDYFGINAKDLNLAQAAFLAAIPQSPNVYSPYGPAFDPESLVGRQHYILDQMVSEKMITKQQATEAKSIDIVATVKPRANQKYKDIKAPYLVQAAKAQLEAKYGAATIQRGGWKIITTVDLNLQSKAEEVVRNAMPEIRRQGGDTAAFVAEDNKTGQIVALVGGEDFFNESHGEINFATDVYVSPGSTFKPYDAAAFIENNNAGAGSVFYDDMTPEGKLPGYPCKERTRPNDKDGKNGLRCLWDYDFRFPGPITMRYALGGSRNVPWVKAMLSTVPNDKSAGRVNSINKTISTVEAMMAEEDSYNCFQPGTDLSPGANPVVIRESQIQCYGSSAIGDGAYLHLDNHTNGIATLARLGTAIPHTYILKITDSSNKVIDEYKQPVGKQAIRPDTAYIVNDMASDPNASYLPGRCTTGEKATCTQLPGGYKFQRYNGWNFAVKTGTTNFKFDGLMAAWSTQYSAVAWVGYHNRNKEMVGRGMEYMTTPIVRPWMQAAHDGLNMKPVNWTKPSGVKTAPAYVIRTHIGVGSIEPSPATDLYPSWYQPPKGSGGGRTIDVVSNQNATSCTPELAKKTESGGTEASLSVDVFDPRGGGGQASTTNPGSSSSDTIHNCGDAKPTISLSAPAACNSITGCSFTVTVSKGTHALSGGSYTTAPASTISLVIGGQVAETKAIPADSPDVYSWTFTYTPTSSGTASVRADAVDSVLYSNSSTEASVLMTTTET